MATRPKQLCTAAFVAPNCMSKHDCDVVFARVAAAHMYSLPNSMDSLVVLHARANRVIAAQLCGTRVRLPLFLRASGILGDVPSAVMTPNVPRLRDRRSGLRRPWPRRRLKNELEMRELSAVFRMLTLDESLAFVVEARAATKSYAAEAKGARDQGTALSKGELHVYAWDAITRVAVETTDAPSEMVNIVKKQRDESTDPQKAGISHRVQDQESL